MGDIVFKITDRDKEGYISALTDYYQFFEKKSVTESAMLAEAAYDNLIRGNDLAGEAINNPNLKYFDDILSIVTSSFYSPSQSQRFRYKKGIKKKAGRPPKGQSPTTSNNVGTAGAAESIAKIKSNLLTEYPTLNRRDLEENVDNYCKLIVKINELMGGDVTSSNVAIKNLTDTQIRLGNFLGIDESAKAKQKSAEDKQSIASLSVVFQRTLDELPEIIDRMKYKELRILIEKYDRQELSRIMFELPSFAGISIEEARKFIKEREAKYEAKQ